MDTVLVVVIAGVIIAAIAIATLSGDPKPATARRRRRRAPGPAHRRVGAEPPEVPLLPAAEAWVVPELPTRVDVDADAPPPLPSARPSVDDEPEPIELEDRGAWRRLRSAVLLAVAVVLLGSLAAGLLGAVVLLGYRALDQALG